MAFDSLRLSDIPLKHCAVLRESTNTRPKVWIIEENGVRAVVKDFSVNGFLFRNTVGRLLIWRESKAHRRLKGLKGVPALYRVVDGLALVMEEIRGRNVEGLEEVEKLPESFFHALRGLVERVHLRGLAHCDLKRAPNVMIDRDRNPCIVDWSSAIGERECGFFPLNLLYRRFLTDDLNAVLKIQFRHCPESVSEEEKRRYYHRNKPEKLIRGVRDRLRDLLQRLS